MKNSLYGIYPGKLKYDADYIKNCSEIELFNLVNSYYQIINKIDEFNQMIELYQKQNNLDLERKTQNQKEEFLNMKNLNNIDNLKEFEYTLDFCILQTSRFNTKTAYNPNGRVIITEEFINWCNNWQLYISTMDDETLAFYRNCQYEGKHLDQFSLNKRSIEDLKTIKTYSYKPTNKSIKQIIA